MKQKLLAMMFVLFAVQATVWAEETSGYCGFFNENVTWTLVDSTLTISGTGDMINFDYSNPAPWGVGIKEVVITEGVTSIGGQAFDICHDLTSITIPNSVVWIMDYAFKSCISLTSITIPNSVTSVGDYAFKYCSNLTNVTCLNPVPPILDKQAFYEICSTAILKVPAESVEVYKASDWAQYFSSIEPLDVEAISEVEADRNDAPAIIHDLSGRRVTNPVKGQIYIVNGKAVVM